ncbi:MAG: hypothetical protein ACJ76D_09590 [Solirubrobacterales bacterium]
MAADSVRVGRLLRLLAAASLCLTFGWASAAHAAAEPPLYHYSFGPDGTEGTDFDKVGSIAVDQQTGTVYVIDRAAGTLYRFDEEGHPTGQITGLSYLHPEPNESQVAVDSASHIVYVTSSNSVLAFQANGDPANFTLGSGAGTNQISGFGELLGVAVDANGDIYASDWSGHVRIYEPSGGFLTEFATSEPANLAVAPDGSVYVSRWHSSVLKFTPSAFPVTATTTYTPSSVPLDEDILQSETVAVDPATGNVYISEAWPTFANTRVAVYDPTGNLLATFGGLGEEGELANATAGVAIKGSSGRVFVGTDDGTGATTRSKVEVFAPEEIFEGPPTVVATGVSDVTASTALLRAAINPNTAETTYYFEYGTGDCAAAAGSCVVGPGGSIGSGHKSVAVSQTISGLQPGMTYYYRVVAVNSFDTTAGTERTVTTQGSGLGFALSDSRVWEMVSPPDKLAGLIAASPSGAVQAAADGNKVSYVDIGSIEAGAEGNRAVELSTILSRRTSAGWVSKDITLPHAGATTLAEGSEYDLFTPNLTKAVVEPRDAMPLSPMSSERTPYLRENSEPPVFTPLVTSKEGFANVPPGTEFGGAELNGQVSEVGVDGASRDLTHIVLASKVPLVTGAALGGGGRSLYEWDAGQLHPVSALPADEGGEIVEGLLGSGMGSVRNAVSDDGSRSFWSTGNIGTGANGIKFTGLYVRDVSIEETSRLDLVQAGVTEEGEANPAFQSASADGTVVFFTDSQKLTAGASPSGRDLYRCEIPPGGAADGCTRLTDISTPLPESGESAEVRGVLSASSEDGTRAYFVANAVLDPQANRLGDTATSGDPNLYFWQQGAGVRFVATLTADDASAWGQVNGPFGPPGYVRLLTAAASPSGRHFAFMSQRSLTGEDNQDRTSGADVERVFHYDSASDRLACVSCAPTGATPTGEQDPPDGLDVQALWQNQSVSAALPEATVSAGDQLIRHTVYRPRAVLDDGRIFFNAVGGLVPADSNGNWDVYQYEPTGLGSCDASATGAAITRSGEGCLSLISSGTAEGASSFIDSSTSGDDVFFFTKGRLSVTDQDPINDVYDARVAGTAAVLNPASECGGDACRPTPAPPSAAAAAAETFRGPGNLSRKPCLKGKRRVRSHGKAKCARRKQSEHGRHRRNGRRHGAHR